MMGFGVVILIRYRVFPGLGLGLVCESLFLSMIQAKWAHHVLRAEVGMQVFMEGHQNEDVDRNKNMLTSHNMIILPLYNDTNYYLTLNLQHFYSTINV